MKKLEVRIGILGLSVIMLGCGGASESSAPPASPEPPVMEAPPEAAPAPVEAEAPPAEQAPPPDAKPLELTFQAKSGAKLTGTATLTETAEGVRVRLTLQNVSPGDHGTHVHEKGDCSAPDAASAGGHFNPTGHPHALPTHGPRHLGDLGNITIDKEGNGTLEIMAPGANLKASDPHSFLGRSIIVHEKKDDGGQPTGNAGGRIGCVEIK